MAKFLIDVPDVDQVGNRIDTNRVKIALYKEFGWHFDVTLHIYDASSDQVKKDGLPPIERH